MTKKILLLIALTGFTGVLFADNTGCGLGTMLFKGKSGPVYELSAVTTNGVGPGMVANAIVPGASVIDLSTNTQTMGITSGTSEYQADTPIIVADVNLYVNENMDLLAVDISRGKGEYLDTLLDIMEAENRLAFKYRLKKNFNRIYPNENVTSDEVVRNIYEIYNS